MKRVITVALAVLLLGGVFFVLEFNSFSVVSKGEEIAEYQNPLKALFVIDIQKDLTAKDGKMVLNLKQTDQTIENTNLIIDNSESLGLLVIYITNEFEKSFLIRLVTKGALEEGSPGAAMDQRVKKINNNHFVKHIMDSFSNPELDNFLVKNRVSHIYFTGMVAENCVDKTVKAALNRKYRVTVIRDAIASGSEEMRDNKIEEFKKMGVEILTTAGVLEG